ncbi:unnamed protein product [Fraxinus pennsylvanica]|uniref:Uncharacterized protein n=1 Tax=Fraxinus pennsylvanica TaxID=56036 RepID=A0AAD1Z2F8_9LAMI|nr:unnamed protein product [Fraxinus pennsylvanica]
MDRPGETHLNDLSQGDSIIPHQLCSCYGHSNVSGGVPKHSMIQKETWACWLGRNGKIGWNAGDYGHSLLHYQVIMEMTRTMVNGSFTMEAELIAVSCKIPFSE